MISSFISKNNFIKPLFIALVTVFAVSFTVPETNAEVSINQNGKLGTIKGIVRDNSGKPISDAFVAIFYVGTSKILKQVRSAADGSFLAKVIPGTYTVLAVAQGYNPQTLATVQINPAAELVYGFKLERAGSGNTLPEKTSDRNSSKWRIRNSQSRRSIYQTTDGETPIDENTTDESVTAETTEDAEEEKSRRRGQTIVETYFAGSENGNFAGINFATLVPVNEKAELVFAGQTGIGKNAPDRFEINLQFRPNDKHELHLNTALANAGKVEINDREESLGQFSLQVLDAWRVREGVVVVYGLDYSRFIGAGDDFSVSPRFGFQFDVDSKTRIRSAFTTQTEEQSWQKVIELEDTQVVFHDNTAVQDFVIENNTPLMRKSSRLEFGIERVLDNKSSVEANVFFDTVSSRGVGLVNFPLNALNSNGFEDFVANQQGRARGVRFVYNRRLNGTFSTAAGYAFGNGQKLSGKTITNPADIFEDDMFQTVFGQLTADFDTGTRVNTIFRFSPEATVFAIDPFQGRLAIYDPSLSILITQSLPNLGLPFRAEAIVDARNLFDSQTGANGEEGSLKVTSGRRILRGGISVRF
ncbi:MAG: carboxypeptidase regulatory-like domain-containing protein [Pyrinomonadaceae bacterium]